MKHALSVGILLAAVITLLLLGCDAKPGKSEAIRIRWAHDPETLDPLQLANQTAVEAINLLHLSLLQADIITHEFAPALAQKLPSVQLIGDSLMKLSYTIRPEAKWDNGRPVAASDVEFTLKLMFCPGVPNEAAQNQYRFIRSVLADPKVAQRFTVVCQGQSLDYIQASGDFFILPEAALDPLGQLRHFTLAQLQHRPATAPADSALQAVARRYRAANFSRAAGNLPGCGPYELVQWEKDRYLRFRRKPHWWADQVRPAPFVLQAHARQLDYIVIPDAATASLALRRGDLDVYPQIPAREFARLRTVPAARAALRFYATPSYDVVTAGFNTRRPALADALTRQALSRCFDAANLLKATQLKGGQRTVGIISPSDRSNYNDSLSLTPFDAQGATELLRQAGWQRTSTGWFRKGTHGTREQLRLMVRYRADETLFSTIALQFQATTAALGIPVSLQPTESGAFSVAMQAGDFDMYVRVLKGNPFLFDFTPVFHTLGVGAGNFTGFSTPASDHLIEAIGTARTKERRTLLLRRFQALMQNEAPVVPLFSLPNLIAADRHLTGLHASSLKPGYAAMTIVRDSTLNPAP